MSPRPPQGRGGRLGTMRRILVVGLLAAIVATGCSRVMFGDPDVVKAGESIEDFGEVLTAYDGVWEELDYNDRGVITRSSLDDWDLALSEVESSYRAMSIQLNKVEKTEEIEAFVQALATYLEVHRNSADLIRQCYSNAAQHDPSTCALEVIAANYDQTIGTLRELNVVIADVQEAHGG